MLDFQLIGQLRQDWSPLKIGQTILWTNDHVAPNILFKPDDDILKVFARIFTSDRPKIVSSASIECGIVFPSFKILIS